VSVRLSLTSVQRALTHPAHNARRTWTERAAQLITLQSDDGTRGFGEASPLPGFSRDTLEECGAALRDLDLSDVPESLDAERAALTELERISVAGLARWSANSPRSRRCGARSVRTRSSDSTPIRA
jgi:hypothetical protein